MCDTIFPFGFPANELILLTDDGSQQIDCSLFLHLLIDWFVQEEGEGEEKGTNEALILSLQHPEIHYRNIAKRLNPHTFHRLHQPRCSYNGKFCNAYSWTDSSVTSSIDAPPSTLSDVITSFIASHSGQKVLICIDSFHTYSFSHSDEDVVDFVQFCKVTCQRNTNVTIVISLHNNNNDNLLRSLQHYTDSVLVHRGLASGFAKDVHGQLSFRSATFNYKVLDSSVKIWLI
jgi:hypothetical protein